MNLRLCARLDASHVISHGVHAGLGRVDLDNRGKLAFAALKLLFPVDAHRLAKLEDHGLGIYAAIEHGQLRIYCHARARVVIVLHGEMQVLLHYYY